MFSKLLKIIFILPLDLVACLVLALFNTGYYLLKVRNKPSRLGESAILHVSTGGSVQALLNKVGSLDYLIQYDGDSTEGVFDRNVLAWFPSQGHTFQMEVRGWTIIERRMKLFLFSCFMLFILDVLRQASLRDIRLVRAYDPHLVGIVSYIVARILGCPYLVSIHSNYAKRRELDGAQGHPRVFGSWWLTDTIRHFVLSRADRTMTYFNDRAAWLEAERARRDGIAVIKPRMAVPELDSVDPGAFRKQYGIPDHVRLLSFVGRLSRENYVFDIVQLARRLEGDDWLLVIAGGGVEEDAVQALVEADPVLSKRVMLPGFIPHSRVWGLRRASDLSLCPMGGFSLMEACAMESVTMAYDVEWHSELLEDGVTGILVPEGDVDAMAAKVQRVLGDASLRARMGTAARKKTLDMFDPGKTDRQRRALYASMIDTTIKNEEMI